jgi:hypothetical protein
VGDEENVLTAHAVFVESHGVRNAAESEIGGTNGASAWRHGYKVTDGDDGVESEVSRWGGGEIRRLGSQEALTEGGCRGERKASQKFGDVHVEEGVFGLTAG